MFNELKYTFGNYLAFSRESLLLLVEEYHHAVAPLSQLGLLLGMVLFALFLSNRIETVRWLRLTLMVTGLSWLLIGALWQMRYLAQLDWSAAPMGWAMLVQGTLLVLCVLRTSPVADRHFAVRWTALLSAGFGGFGISMLQWLGGLPLVQVDRFGVDVGSTTLITVAVVLRLPARYSWLLLIPWLWSVRQFTRSWPLGDDVGMLFLPWLTACILLSVILRRKDER